MGKMPNVLFTKPTTTDKHEKFEIVTISTFTIIFFEWLRQKTENIFEKNLNYVTTNPVLVKLQPSFSFFLVSAHKLILFNSTFVLFKI